MSEPQIYEGIVKKMKEEDYKARCEKAIEYINNEYDVEPKELYGLVSADELLDILRGKE